MPSCVSFKYQVIVVASPSPEILSEVLIRIIIEETPDAQTDDAFSPSL